MKSTLSGIASYSDLCRSSLLRGGLVTRNSVEKRFAS